MDGAAAKPSRAVADNATAGDSPTALQVLVEESKYGGFFCSTSQPTHQWQAFSLLAIVIVEKS